MTRKDFQLIADTIKNLDTLGDAERDAVAKAFADKLAYTNDRFNRGLFLHAATGKLFL